MIQRYDGQNPAKILVFTGHRVDAANREQRRFPRTSAAEERARHLIKAEVQDEAKKTNGCVIGYAGGASGGDILFHEICGQLGIQTYLYLAVPRNLYVRESVQDAGAKWVARFDKLCVELCETTRILSESLELPPSPQTAKSYTIWQRNNLWMLHNALIHGASKVVLIGLWNNEKGDGPSGTGDMVASAKKRGTRIRIVDAKQLLE